MTFQIWILEHKVEEFLCHWKVSRDHYGTVCHLSASKITSGCHLGNRNTRTQFVWTMFVLCVIIISLSRKYMCLVLANKYDDKLLETAHLYSHGTYWKYLDIYLCISKQFNVKEVGRWKWKLILMRKSVEKNREHLCSKPVPLTGTGGVVL